MTTISKLFTPAMLLLCLWVSPLIADPPWQSFRGPHSSGVAESNQVVMELDRERNEIWRTELPETGWSSPLTDGKRLWMTSAMTLDVKSKEGGDSPGPGKAGGKRLVYGGVTLIAYCLDATTGKVLHRIELAKLDSPDTINVMNSYASPTGVWVGDRVVMHFGLYGTFCLNASSGEVNWRQESLTYEDSIGPGSSLAHADGIVIFPCDGMGEQFVVGLSLETGETVWRTHRPLVEAKAKELRSSYSTPLIINVNGQNQAVVPGTQWCVAYDVRTGKEIWRLQHTGFSLGCTPIEVDGKVIIATGYGGNELVAIDPKGSGDVTNSHVLWRQSKGRPLMPSPTRVGELLYTIADGGIAYALRHSDGEVVWRQRLGGKFSSSPFASGNRLLIGDHEGNVTVFRAGDEYQELARHELGEQIMASPVPIGEDLILRTDKAVYRFANRGL